MMKFISNPAKYLITYFWYVKHKNNPRKSPGLAVYLVSTTIFFLLKLLVSPTRYIK